jgi:hypothetical protein
VQPAADRLAGGNHVVAGEHPRILRTRGVRRSFVTRGV